MAKNSQQKEELLSQICEQLKEEPSRPGWIQVCRYLEGAFEVCPEWALDVCLPHIEKSVAHWPAKFRAAPYDWSLKLASDALPFEALSIVSGLCATWCFIGVRHSNDVFGPIAKAFLDWLRNLPPDCPAITGFRVSSRLPSLESLLRNHSMTWNRETKKLKLNSHEMTIGELIDGTPPWASQQLDALPFDGPLFRELEHLDLSAATFPDQWMTSNLHYGNWASVMSPNGLPALKNLSCKKLTYANLHGHCNWHLDPDRELPNLAYLDVGGGGHLREIWPAIETLTSLRVLNANTHLDDFIELDDGSPEEWEESDHTSHQQYMMHEFFHEREMPIYRAELVNDLCSLFPSPAQIESLQQANPNLEYLEATIADLPEGEPWPAVSATAWNRDDDAWTRADKYRRRPMLEWSARYESDPADQDIPEDLIYQLEAAMHRLEKRGEFGLPTIR